MNDAPTTGYEVDVGNKTSFRVVAHSSLYRVLKRPQEFVNKTPETIFIFWGPPTKMQKGLLKIIQRVSASFPNMTAYVVSPSRMKQFDDLFRGETGKDRYLRATSCTVSPPFSRSPEQSWLLGLLHGMRCSTGLGVLEEIEDPGGGGGPSPMSPCPHLAPPPPFLLPREKSRSWLSTGWFTMVIAVELCDAVHVYGMVPPNYCG